MLRGNSARSLPCCGHVKVAHMTSSIVSPSSKQRLAHHLQTPYPPIIILNGRRRSMHSHNASFLPWTSAITTRRISVMDVKTTRSGFAVAQVSGITTAAAPENADSAYKSTSCAIERRSFSNIVEVPRPYPLCPFSLVETVTRPDLKIKACSASGSRVPLHPLLHPG